ncbi:MAG: hypothetical protein LPK01_12945 [Hymenobacteraceae bacterium]|nr:hypothetical protein [Hymenobacteraceae bacterium]
MKFIILFSFFLLTIKISVANEIDNLKTQKDVHQFLIDKFDKDFYDLFLLIDDPNASSAYSKGKFFKIDLDNNGLSDLVVNGRYLLIVIDNGKGKFQSHIIN